MIFTIFKNTLKIIEWRKLYWNTIILFALIVVNLNNSTLFAHLFAISELEFFSISRSLYLFNGIISIIFAGWVSFFFFFEQNISCRLYFRNLIEGNVSNLHHNRQKCMNVGYKNTFYTSTIVGLSQLFQIP